MITNNQAAVEIGAKRNREQWLNDCGTLILPLIKKRCGLSLEDRQIEISCGFPASGVRVNRKGSFTTGQCFHTAGTQRKRMQIFIHPARTDELQISETVAHEILHALLPGDVGHQKPFAQAAKKLGLVGKPTSTELGEELAEHMKEIVKTLGPYPHEAVTAGGPKQKTNLLKAMCHECGYVIRVTQKWLDAVGYPYCPCNGQEMGPDDADWASDGLVPVKQDVEYKIKFHRTKPTDPTYDPRWAVRMAKEGTAVRWYIVDYGEPFVVCEHGAMAVMGVVTPRLTAAKSREEAVGLLEALRDGDTTYDALDVQDEADEPEQWEGKTPEELEAEWNQDNSFLDEDEDDVSDFTDDSDPRFSFEIERGIEWDYDKEAKAREMV